MLKFAASVNGKTSSRAPFRKTFDAIESLLVGTAEVINDGLTEMIAVYSVADQ